MPYKLECQNCQNKIIRDHQKQEIFCPDCVETTRFEKVECVHCYTVIIEVDGEIKHNGEKIQVSGVTGRKAYGKSEEKAKRKAVEDFKKNPDYNTDISVNSSNFPNDRYLDDWGYKSSTARAIDAVPREDLSPNRVRWRDRGISYCKWERGI
jgi:hypothetical protein